MKKLSFLQKKSAQKELGPIDQQSLGYRLLECVPGLLSWSIPVATFFIIRYATPVFAIFMLLYVCYWIANAADIVVKASKGIQLMDRIESTDWQAKLSTEYPDWRDYYYLTLIPYASESINVIRPTVQAIADSDFPSERKVLILSSEAALPAGRAIAEELKREFEGKFADIYITEHVLKPGELKGKASNENHCGRLAYRLLVEEKGIPADHILLSSNDADMHIHPSYPGYLLYTYLSDGPDHDYHIYEPVPADYNDFWGAGFFTRMTVTSGVLWRLTLQIRNNTRCTVYAFYNMSLKTLDAIGYWDPDIIPEDERTMFKALAAFGSRFKVIPLFTIVKGTAIRGEGLAGSALEQYTQQRRWAWGASEFAHSVSVCRRLPPEKRKAMYAPIFNQVRGAVGWTLTPIFIVFGGFIPGIINPAFSLTAIGRFYNIAIAVIMGSSSVIAVWTILFDFRLSPKPPEKRQKNFWARIGRLAQWALSPAVSLAFSSLPAFDAQTRLLLNRRLSYVESQKE